jgi:hypothetical protein
LGERRDIAVLNGVPVDGFGWVRRNVPEDDGLRAELPTERELMLADLDLSLRILSDSILDTTQIGRIRDVIRVEAPFLDAVDARLAHGDLDATHIYCHQGRYSGLIDLGEIRGTGRYYDLGHFGFHDGETLPVVALPYLLEGYREVTSLPSDADRRIALASLLIGVHFLARTHARLADKHRLHAVAAITRNVKFFRA